MNKNDSTFKDWMAALYKLFDPDEDIFVLDHYAYREYYDEGLTPEQAFKEDLGYLN